jgi:hypothetical protein
MILAISHLAFLSMQNKNHILTGVSFEPQVLDYLNDLSKRMRMSRSWVLNTIVYEYASLIEGKKLMPKRSVMEVIRK